LIISSNAQVDLLNIGDYIAQDNVDAAITFVLRLKQRCVDIAQFPGTGRKRNEIKPNLRSATEGDYVILYRRLPDGIEIVRVVHGKRDIGKITFPD